MNVPALRPARATARPASPIAPAADTEHDDDAGAMIAAQIRGAFDAEQEREVTEQAELLAQRAQYDFAAQERAEIVREYNDERAMLVEQAKLDDEVLKKWIAMI